MIENPVLLLVAILILIFLVLLVPLLKIVVMIDVYGWEKTKELLQDQDWDFPTWNGVKKRLE